MLSLDESPMVGGLMMVKWGCRHFFSIAQSLYGAGFLASELVGNYQLRQAGWEPEYMWRSPSLAEKLFQGMNLPVISIMALRQFLPHSRVGTIPITLELAIEGLFAIIMVGAVGLLWFLVGRWLDRRLGWLPTSERSGTKRASFIAGTALALLLVLVVLAIAAVRIEATHFSIALLGWSLFGCVVLWTYLRRSPVSTPLN